MSSNPFRVARRESQDQYISGDVRVPDHNTSSFGFNPDLRSAVTASCCQAALKT